jgi:transcription elongation factor SPT6
LQEAYEDVTVETVNRIGVDLNNILQYPHLEAPLQFVCGLGPRKAKFILESLRKKVSQVRYRMQLWVDKLMGKNVYINAIGFIKVTSHEEDHDVLDNTRIHPENYVLAKKIAKDALDMEQDDREECVNMIMAEPEKLEDLDLDDYAEHLA